MMIFAVLALLVYLFEWLTDTCHLLVWRVISFYTDTKRNVLVGHWLQSCWSVASWPRSRRREVIFHTKFSEVFWRHESYWPLLAYFHVDFASILMLKSLCCHSLQFHGKERLVLLLKIFCVSVKKIHPTWGSSQVTFIYLELYTIQLGSKQLHGNEQENRTNDANFIKCDTNSNLLVKQLSTIVIIRLKSVQWCFRVSNKRQNLHRWENYSFKAFLCQYMCVFSP